MPASAAPMPPILECITRLESGDRQFDSNGNPLISPTGDVGYMQLNLRTWEPLSKEMGLQIRTSAKDNVEMGLWIYTHYGVKPWTTSKMCRDIDTS